MGGVSPILSPSRSSADPAFDFGITCFQGVTISFPNFIKKYFFLRFPLSKFLAFNSVLSVIIFEAWVWIHVLSTILYGYSNMMNLVCVYHKHCSCKLF